MTQPAVRRLLITANVVPSSPILVTLMMEAPSSSETSTRRNITEDAILHSHCHENFKSYTILYTVHNQVYWFRAQFPFVNNLSITCFKFYINKTEHLGQILLNTAHTLYFKGKRVIYDSI
jgi:hypothetical protein